MCVCVCVREGEEIGTTSPTEGFAKLLGESSSRDYPVRVSRSIYGRENARGTRTIPRRKRSPISGDFMGLGLGISCGKIVGEVF